MLRFPNCTQYDSMDCGPSCLRMIALYYGKDISLVYLRELCCFTNRGVSILGIDRAAKLIGFDTICAKIKFDQIDTSVPLPCILHWNNEHYVVLYKVKKILGRKYYFVSDPIGSRFKYSEKEFVNCWLNKDGLGVVICMKPNPKFFESNSGDQSRGIRWFFQYTKPYYGAIFQVLVGLFFGSLLLLIFPFFTQALVDYGIGNRNLGFIWTVLIAQILLILGNSVIGFIRNWVLLHIGMRINITIISDFIIKLTKLPMSFFDSKMIGDVLQRIGDNSRIKEFVTETSLSILFSLLNIIILSVIVLIYNFWIFLIFTIGSLLHIGWILLFMNKRAILDKKMFAQTSSSQSNIIQLVMGMQEIKLCGCENQKRWEWEDVQAKIYSIAVRGLSLLQYQQSGAILLLQLKNALITALIASLTIKGQMTLGMMMSIQYIIGQLNSPIEQLIQFVRKYQDAKLSLERINDVYEIEEEVHNTSRLITNIPNDSVTIHNVYFRYDKLSTKYTIEDISLQIPKGRTTAIVGLSGSGKTTLLKLLLGFYTPEKGDIFIGNQSLSKYDIREWRKNCGVVMQEGYIFSNTIAANIAPGVNCINQERLIECAHTANILGYVKALPMGFNTIIGGDGLGLSMGQKQRILIARALYKKPNYILMDEATNSLDATNESEIMERMRSFLHGKTALIIAHRLSTIQNADNIIVMENGRIIEQGKHSVLISKQGKYYDLIRNQLSL